MPVSPSVLIVDDEPHVRAYVEMLLKSVLAEAQVLQAGDEATALRLYSECRPVLVLLDINLIGASGLDTLDRLLAIDPDAEIIMLTSVNVRHTVEAAMTRGAAGYILKDENFEAMAEAIREAIRAVYPQ